ncbi:hypothetical protein [Nostoc sp. 'Peltigera membranacea cyanobiont' N6]|uniref:hypothetical protein n=1 Tax=Nostoc sp. 'Peltigera membranacea cyanobiont' N6 TaxID=1261031 RepID=UPI000CF325BB|nr:hypothetical protein [Nostoc sp. 'Peltigera membranacea cyanobiont' N6]
MQTTKTEMDQQMDVDRDYFNQFPGITNYCRKPFHNELRQGLEAHGRYPKQMQVFNLGQGLRAKKFLF